MKIKPSELVALALLVLAILALVVIVAACTLVIGDQNKVGGPELKREVEINRERAHGRDRDPASEEKEKSQ